MNDAPARSDPFVPISDADRMTFRRDGFLLVRGALDEPLRERLETAVDALYARTERAGGLEPDGSLHAPGGVLDDEVFAELLDHPAVFPHVRGHLGWNVLVDHSSVDVYPPLRDRPGPVWSRLRDGHRQRTDLDVAPRPSPAMKVGYVLSDLSEHGRGATIVVPGSHLGDRARTGTPVEITAEPGDALVFDRRLWHARSENRSGPTRKMIFLGYTHRWIRTRDDALIGRGVTYGEGLSPLRRRLLGLVDEDAGRLGAVAGEETVPLLTDLKKRGPLDLR